MGRAGPCGEFGFVPGAVGEQRRNPGLVSSGTAWAQATASRLPGPQQLPRLRPHLWALHYYGQAALGRGSLHGDCVGLKIQCIYFI